MQGFVDAVSRRKKILLLAAAVGAGTFASYSYYKSESFHRRRKQAILLLHGLNNLLNTFTTIADSTALISTDLNTFLRSDQSEVPQSLRQLFKVFQCTEFQNLLATSSFSICTEIFLRPPRSKSKSWTQSPESSGDHNGWRKKNRRSTEHNLPERLLNKLFSEAGRGFASAVVGSAVRSLVLGVFQELEKNSKSESGSGSGSESEGSTPETFELGPSGVVRASSKSRQWYYHPVDGGEGDTFGEKALSLACSGKGKLLIADCIQQFVECAVSTYLDKTRDVNVFEEMVEAVTMPVHHLPAKDMLVSVCNGAVDTFVRTSYQVLRSSPGEADGKDNLAEKVLHAVAAPSNRSLVMDVAGRISSEAVRSFVTVVQSEMVFVKNRAMVAGEAATRALVLLTVFMAMFLHLITR